MSGRTVELPETVVMPVSRGHAVDRHHDVTAYRGDDVHYRRSRHPQDAQPPAAELSSLVYPSVIFPLSTAQAYWES